MPYETEQSIKIAQATQQINARIAGYTHPLYSRILNALSPNTETAQRGVEVLTTTLHFARFYDLYSEEDDYDYFTEAQRKKGELYGMMEEDTGTDLENLLQTLLPFVDFEKQIWQKIKAGQQLTDDEFEEFRLGKSSDALYYARVLQEFIGRDVTREIYADMQLIDILSDIQEYERDLEKNQPNLLYIILSRHVTQDQIPQTKEETIRLAKDFGIHERLINIAESVLESTQDFDYTGIEFLRAGSERKFEDIQKELGDNPVIRKGIRFLLEQQLPSGEFPTYVDDDPSFSNPQPITNVFNTAVILHAMLPFKDTVKVREASQRGIKWLTDQQDTSGYWNFFGKSVHDVASTEQVPPDVDSNSYILSALEDWGVQLPQGKLLDDLMKNRNDKGLFITWIPGTTIWWDPAVEPYTSMEEIDPVVNANAAYMCYQERVEIPEIEKYLEEKIVTGEFDRPSNYYVSAASFLYAVSQSIRFNPQFTRGEVGEACRKKVMSFIEESDITTPLEIALAVSAALNGFIPYPDSFIDAAIARLEALQDKDGSWNTYPFYRGYRRYYGSRALTTALAVEALALRDKIRLDYGKETVL